jgi:hypothetical protein
MHTKHVRSLGILGRDEGSRQLLHSHPLGLRIAAIMCLQARQRITAADHLPERAAANEASLGISSCKTHHPQMTTNQISVIVRAVMEIVVLDTLYLLPYPAWVRGFLTVSGSQTLSS